MTTKHPLLKLENIKKEFPVKGGFLGSVVNSVKAVDGVEGVKIASTLLNASLKSLLINDLTF